MSQTPDPPAAERSRPPETSTADRDGDTIGPDSERGATGRRGDEPPVLPRVSGDERDLGWGDDDGRRDAAWYRRERPPHHE